MYVLYFERLTGWAAEGQGERFGPVRGSGPKSVRKGASQVETGRLCQGKRLYDQQGGGGTSPVEFERDLRELRSLLERFTRQPREFTWAAHPHFGTMNEEEWMRLAYLHADHHLRQFGC
jgi:hydrogenase maturation factor HypF (carbamoyltransferase family)